MAHTIPLVAGPLVSFLDFDFEKGLDEICQRPVFGLRGLPRLIEQVSVDPESHRRLHPMPFLSGPSNVFTIAIHTWQLGSKRRVIIPKADTQKPSRRESTTVPNAAILPLLMLTPSIVASNLYRNIFLLVLPR